MKNARDLKIFIDVLFYFITVFNCMSGKSYRKTTHLYAWRIIYGNLNTIPRRTLLVGKNHFLFIYLLGWLEFI